MNYLNDGGEPATLVDFEETGVVHLRETRRHGPAQYAVRAL
jgi:hypothetical protein